MTVLGDGPPTLYDPGPVPGPGGWPVTYEQVATGSLPVVEAGAGATAERGTATARRVPGVGLHRAQVHRPPGGRAGRAAVTAAAPRGVVRGRRTRHRVDRPPGEREVRPRGQRREHPLPGGEEARTARGDGPRGPGERRGRRTALRPAARPQGTPGHLRRAAHGTDRADVRVAAPAGRGRGRAAHHRGHGRVAVRFLRGDRAGPGGPRPAGAHPDRLRSDRGLARLPRVRPRLRVHATAAPGPDASAAGSS